MKRISSSVVLIVMVFLLTACTLAGEDEYYDLVKEAKEIQETEVETEDLLLEPEDYYIPSRIDFFMYDENWEEIDVSEYIYVEMACPGMTVFENCIGPNMGESIQANKVHIATEGDSSTVTLEMTIYILRNTASKMGYDVVLENISGDTKLLENEYVVAIRDGNRAAINGFVETFNYEQEHRILDFTIAVEVIDVLDSVEIREFDTDDNLLINTTINKEELLDKLTLNEKTAYYFIIESFEDPDGGYYEERSYYDTESTEWYLYKFANEDGFLNGDRLTIKTN